MSFINIFITCRRLEISRQAVSFTVTCKSSLTHDHTSYCSAETTNEHPLLMDNEVPKSLNIAKGNIWSKLFLFYV